ncbi:MULTISPECIES: YybH family protein [Leeia]|uniref:Nuclear transport factor 2 family protein n=1 Tax=Leeia aquatica TaxID=2725557 RepID=A0A847S6D2_9NEIS|nr:nuclear transport factor 2 family protein [Leeia aquatica]NLR75323.1 nuclear transport factor 2 family protein [Leeia aquatica]
MLDTAASPQDIEDAFYHALEHRDLSALTALWADDERAYCILPLGQRLNGLQEIMTGWELLFGQSPDLHIHLHQRTMVQDGQLAVHSVVQLVQVMSQGEQRHWITATNVFLHTERGWRLLAHHASPSVAEPDSSLVLH